MSKDVTKTLRFGFFKVYIHCDINDINIKINKLKKSNIQDDQAKLKMLQTLKEDLKNVSKVIWDLISEIRSNKISSIHTIQNKLIEVDKTTFMGYDKNEEQHAFFQMVHDRDDALSKKKLNQERESIPLDDDEYISEFAGIIYHKETKCFMIQYNKYSVSINQIAEFLTRSLIEKYQNNMTERQKYKKFPAYIELRAIMDESRLNAVNNNNCLEKMIIKGDLSAVENIKKASNNKNTPILNVGNAILGMNGYEFTLTITAKKTREKRKVEYDSIDQDFCKQLYNAYENVGRDKDNISVTMQYQNEHDVRETLIWSSPLKESYIPFTINSRKEIEYSELYDKMILNFRQYWNEL